MFRFRRGVLHIKIQRTLELSNDAEDGFIFPLVPRTLRKPLLHQHRNQMSLIKDQWYHCRIKFLMEDNFVTLTQFFPGDSTADSGTPFSSMKSLQGSAHLQLEASAYFLLASALMQFWQKPLGMRPERAHRLHFLCNVEPWRYFSVHRGATSSR